MAPANIEIKSVDFVFIQNGICFCFMKGWKNCFFTFAVKQRYESSFINVINRIRCLSYLRVGHFLNAMGDYDTIANNYNDFDQDAITLLRLGYPVVEDLMGDFTGKSVLDYGCGTGIFSRFLQSKGAFVTGVDVSEKMIEVARRNSPETIDYCTLSGRGLDFLAENKFDFVVSNFVLCTLPSLREIAIILGQIHRVLKQGGLLVFMNSNWDKSNGREFVSFKLEPCKTLVSGQPVRVIIKSDPPILLHDYFWSIPDYRKLLKESGFKTRFLMEKIAGDDGLAWLDEKKYPPYYAISAGK
jgi:2-polyprenyl-3-methyl-5-hydroxy-6-metoxy-1,4-benzoquinol methylase